MGFCLAGDACTAGLALTGENGAEGFALTGEDFHLGGLLFFIIGVRQTTSESEL